MLFQEGLVSLENPEQTVEYLVIAGVPTVVQTGQPGQLTGGFGPIEKFFLVPPAREHQLKFFLLCIIKTYTQLQIDLGLIPEGYFVHLIINDTTEKDKKVCNIVGPQTTRPW
jgi:hypothetical protein